MWQTHTKNIQISFNDSDFIVHKCSSWVRTAFVLITTFSPFHRRLADGWFNVLHHQNVLKVWSLHTSLFEILIYNLNVLSVILFIYNHSALLMLTLTSVLFIFVLFVKDMRQLSEIKMILFVFSLKSVKQTLLNYKQWT